MALTRSLVSGSLLHNDGFLASKRDILVQMVTEDSFYFVNHIFLFFAMSWVLTLKKLFLRNENRDMWYYCYKIKWFHVYETKSACSDLMLH